MSWGRRPPVTSGGRGADLTWFSSRRTVGCSTLPDLPPTLPKRGQAMTSGRSQPDLKPRPMDALVVLFVVLSAAIIAVLVYGKSESENLTATVKHRGETVAQVVLDTLQEEKTVTIDG